MVGMGSSTVDNQTFSNGTHIVNEYFYKIWLPLTLITMLSFVGVFTGHIQINWWLVVASWFLIGPVGTGVGLHRLFSHRQFETCRPIEIALAVLGTLSAYGPIMYWVTEHQYHHKHVDKEEDINSPAKGFWHSFLYWRFLKDATSKVDIRNYCSIRAARDPLLVNLSLYFVHIIYFTVVVLWLIDTNLLVSLFLVPVFIEHLRVNMLNSVAHIKLPGSYRLFDSNDNSYNNVVLGWLTFGFGWHNAHHANPKELVNSHRWYELDIEGLIGKALSKNERR